MEDVAVGLSSEAKNPDPESFWLRMRLAARKYGLAAVAVTSLTVGQGFAEAAGGEMWARARDLVADMVQEQSELNELVERSPTSYDKDSNADAALNLLEMSIPDFEELIVQRYQTMDYSTVQAQSSHSDTGVDIVATSDGGRAPLKTVVQTKRWRSTVPSSAIRELLGAKHTENADEATFIATSNFSNSATEIADENGITLIDGEELVNLLRNNLGIGARIGG